MHLPVFPSPSQHHEAARGQLGSSFLPCCTDQSQGVKEGAEPHHPTAKYSCTNKLHKYTASPKPLTERSCSLLDTQRAPGKLWKGLLSTLLCTFAVPQLSLPTGPVNKYALMWLPKLKTLYHPLTCCRPGTLLFQITPAILVSQVRAPCSPLLAPWQHTGMKCPLCQASVQGEQCLVPYCVWDAGAHRT